MDEDRWQRMQALFESASGLDPSEVDEFLERECGDDTELRAELRSLLRRVLEVADPLAEAVGTAAREAVAAADSRPVEVGVTLGKYRIVEELGGGGMGTVYAAEDRELRRKVALKLLPSLDVQDAGRLERFRREAQALARLSHPNIVTIHSVEHVDDCHFLTMELVEGHPLSADIPPEGLALERFFAVAASLCRGLAAAHEQGVTHRDLKPANVMLADGGTVKILDFGLAKLRRGEGEREATLEPSGTLTCTGIVMGTIPYMSPEQVEGKPLDPRSDIFSLGVVLYEMACGSRPFKGESSAALTSAILTGEPPSLTGLRPDLPGRLAQIIQRCLEKDPEKRYRDVESLRRDLTLLREGIERHPKISRGLTRLAAMIPRGRRWPMRAGAAVVAIVTLVAVLIGFDSKWPAPAAPAEASDIDSLAVLPLRNDSEDEGQEYLANGMTELLITELSQSGLKVVSRTSVMRYRETELPVAEIARQLSVDAVVEGSVLRSGDRVRVNARLVHAGSDVPLWDRSYERDLQDILMLQREVARSIASEIRGNLAFQRKDRLALLGKVSTEAAEAFFKGLNANTWAKNEYFQQAIDLEPDFALAYTALASNLVTRGFAGWPYPPEEAFGRAREAATSALAIEPDLSAGHAILGWVAFYFDWQWPPAEQAFRRALEIDPGNSDAHLGLAFLLAAVGRFDEALEETDRVRELDPLSTWVNADLCQILYFARRYDDAFRQLHEHYDPLSPNVFRVRWLLLEATGDLHAAAVHRAIFEQLDQSPEPVVEALREALETSGRDGFWRTFIDIHMMTPANLMWAVKVARAYTFLGEKEQALTWLETAYERRRPRMVFLGVDQIWDPLRSDPRFEKLLAKMKLPQAVRRDEPIDRGPLR